MATQTSARKRKTAAKKKTPKKSTRAKPSSVAKKASSRARAAAAANTATSGRFILLPANQMQAAPNAGNPEISNFLIRLSNNVSQKAGLQLAPRTKTKGSAISVNVIDSIHENGAKLVTISESQMADFRFSYPGLRIIPEKFYDHDFRLKPEPAGARAAGARPAAGFSTKITVTDNAGKAVPDVYLVAFTDFAQRVGVSGTTNASGVVNLTLSGKKVERIYVYPEHTYWGFFKQNFSITAAYSVKLKPIDLTFDDSLRHFYPTRQWPAITNKVRVGIIDTGFGPHKDISIKDGMNMVLGEDPHAYADQEGHGTHVAGIIAAHGDIPGVAAGVELYIYRVFPAGKSASNYDIMKAIDRAKADQCDLVNMSLGESGLDEGIVSSIKDAYSEGLLCFAANGNDDRKPVSFPASYSLSIAVSAMGRKGCFPAQTVQTGIVHAPFGTDKKNFIADFSNIGPETDLTAPGVGIISTYPDDRYAIMDGTSMACPAAVGMAARLLSTQTTILAMPRNQARTDAIQKFLANKIKSLGFGANFEGKGMLFP